MTSRRGPVGLLGVAALLPPIVWLWPALFGRSAPSFRDQADFFYPLKLYTADRIRRGELPLWNPLSGCGEPWLANLQSGVFYPPGVFFLLPSAALAAGLFLLFHFALAAGGTWKFLREEGSSPAAALAGAALAAGSGVSASLSAYWNHFGAFAWVPLLAALARGGLGRRSSRLGFAGALALQALAGSPEISAATVVLCALLVWRARSAPETGFQPGVRLRFSRLSAAMLLALLLAACTLAPFAELALHSDRRAPLEAGLREYGAVRGEGLLSAIGISRGERNLSYLQSLTVGALALLLVAASAVERERRRLVLLLGGVAVAGVVLAAASPPGTWIRMLPPFDHVRYPEKALFATAFALSILAGLGLDSLRFAPGARRRVFVAVAACAALALAAFSRGPAVERAVLAAGVVAAAGIAFLPSESRTSAALQGVTALLLVTSLALGGRSLFRFVPEREIRAVPETDGVLEKQPGRVLTPPTTALAPWVLHDLSYDVATIRRQRISLLGYTNLLANVRTVRTASALATDASRRVERTIDEGRDLQRAAGTASGRLLWTPFQPQDMGSRKVGEFFRAPMNPYRPRISFVRDFVIDADASHAWTMAAEGGIDWTSRVSVDRAPDPRPLPGARRQGYLVLRIAVNLPEEVVGEVGCDSAGLLVLTDAAYPGWKADVDGRPAPILRADGCFRAVAVPAGSHRVTFRYRPLAFYVGCGISAAALLSLILLAWAGEPRRADSLL